MVVSYLTGIVFSLTRHVKLPMRAAFCKYSNFLFRQRPRPDDRDWFELSSPSHDRRPLWLRLIATGSVSPYLATNLLQSLHSVVDGGAAATDPVLHSDPYLIRSLLQTAIARHHRSEPDWDVYLRLAGQLIAVAVGDPSNSLRSLVNGVKAGFGLGRSSAFSISILNCVFRRRRQRTPFR
jgi:hypothetical protein